MTVLPLRSSVSLKRGANNSRAPDALQHLNRFKAMPERRLIKIHEAHRDRTLTAFPTAGSGCAETQN